MARARNKSVERTVRAAGEAGAAVAVTARKPRPDAPASFFDGFAGTNRGAFVGEPPSFVDKSQPAGSSDLSAVTANNPDLWSFARGAWLFWSPNLVWLAFALAYHFAMPYDLSRPPTLRETAARGGVHAAITLAFFGFFHVTLDGLGWGKRPFAGADRQQRLSKTLHNVWHSLSGVAQFTAWEAAYVYALSTGRLPYLDVDPLAAATTPAQLAQWLAWWWIIPFYRETHFYFCHRMIHHQPMYVYVHSLHHRNTDTEPFSGLSMHPIEHLFYYSCGLVVLYAKAPPIAFLWSGYHCLLAPAASHSGYEDVMQSDQFHYIHHKFFECNYGTMSMMYDRAFGTFRNMLPQKKKMGKASSAYKGAAEGEAATGNSIASDAKANLLRLPKWDSAAFDAACCVALPWALYAVLVSGELPVDALALPRLGIDGAQGLALAVSVGPFLIGSALILATRRGALRNPRKALLYPFHKEPLFGAFSLNAVLGVLLNVVPVYHAVHLLAARPGAGVYHALWGAA